MAVKAIQRRGDDIFITSQNLIEFWAVATRPDSANGLGMTPVEASQETNKIEQLFPIAPDIPVIFPTWQRLVLSAGVSGVQVHDARLVAVMLAHNITHILTFNTDDFKRFTAEVTVVHPKSAVI